MSFLASFTNSSLRFLLYMSPALEVSHVKRVKCEAVRILGDGDQCVGDLGIRYPCIPCSFLTDSKHR